MIPLNVAAKTLAATLTGVVADIYEKQSRSTEAEAGKRLSRDQALVNHLQTDIQSLHLFSRKQSLRGKAIRPEVIGYLSAICYGHIRLSNGLMDILKADGRDAAIICLSEIANPFYSRGSYVLTVLQAYC